MYVGFFGSVASIRHQRGGGGMQIQRTHVVILSILLYIPTFLYVILYIFPHYDISILFVHPYIPIFLCSHIPMFLNLIYIPMFPICSMFHHNIFFLFSSIVSASRHRTGSFMYAHTLCTCCMHCSSFEANST